MGQALELQHTISATHCRCATRWVGTHNSFNTISNSPPSISNNDSNQHVSLVDQLRLGILGIEVDVHWNPSVWAGGAERAGGLPRGTHQMNAGCTYERSAERRSSAPVRAWMDPAPERRDPALPRDHLDAPAAFDAATKMINDTLGDRIYKPAAGQSCPLLPMSLKRSDVLDAGKQIVIAERLERDPRNRQRGPRRCSTTRCGPRKATRISPGYPACASPSVVIGDYGTARSLLRGLDVRVGRRGRGRPDTVSRLRRYDMVKCGVNLFGLDQLDPSDPRLEAMVWSWAARRSGDRCGPCAVFDGSDGRFLGACKGADAIACVDPRAGVVHHEAVR